MTTFKKILLLLFVVFTCENLCAQDWEYLGTGINDSKYYYKPNTSNTAWIKEVSSQVEYYPKNNNGKAKIVDGYHITLWKFDCEGKRIGLIQRSTYSNKGIVVDSFKLKEYEVELDYVVPDSLGENILKSFCNKQP